MSELEKMLEDYWNKSRELESQTINDLEKYLWLANAAAATISIGYIQARVVVSMLQSLGAWLFVIGIIFLVVMKSVSAINSSRDRRRFQESVPEITAENVKERIKNIRDRRFVCLKGLYLFFQFGAGVLFIAGCICVLIGVTL